MRLSVFKFQQMRKGGAMEKLAVGMTLFNALFLLLILVINFAINSRERAKGKMSVIQIPSKKIKFIKRERTHK